MNSRLASDKIIPEPCNSEELLRFWLIHAHKGRDRHDQAARQSDTLRYVLGVPTIILSAAVGTSVFTSLSNQVDLAFKVVLGLVSIAAAVMASLQTFYNFAGRAESHRLAGVKYKTIVRELEQTLACPLDASPKLDEYLGDLRRRLDDIELSAPVVPEDIYSRVEDSYQRAVFQDRAAAMLKPVHPPEK